MEGEVINLVFRQLVDADFEDVAGFLTRIIDRIDDNNSSWLLLAQDKIKENLSDPCRCVDDRDVLRKNSALLQMFRHTGPETVVPKKDITASQNNSLFIHWFYKVASGSIILPARLSPSV